ncbi:MAG TPA: hypothetical protein VHY48_13065 [Acidobacteriaceae bacterium]|jgi:hypothetical protein|nr:hypothetical protein [Acidobacteriaceae bacterium]
MSDDLLDPIPPDGETRGSTSSLSDESLETLLLSRARTGACPPPDLLFAAQEDVLPAPAGASIREHAAHCSLCQTLLAELVPAEAAFSPGSDARVRNHIETTKNQHGTTPKTTTFRRPSMWLSIAGAAAVVAIVAVIGSASHRRTHFTTNTPVLAVNRPLDLPELHQITPLAPPDDVPLMVTRGASIHGPTINDLLPAFRPYNRGDFVHAATIFRTLTTRFPQSSIPSLYLGISQLQLNQNRDAQASLLQSLTLAGPVRHDDAAWYLAVADLRLHDRSSAAPLLRELCTKQSAYASRACAIEQQIAHP